MTFAFLCSVFTFDIFYVMVFALFFRQTELPRRKRAEISIIFRFFHLGVFACGDVMFSEQVCRLHLSI